MLENESVSKLIRCGWKKVNVDIIDFQEGLSTEDAISICESHFNQYIMVKEKETNTELGLKFLV